MDALTWWRELTDAQATIISTLLTGLGILIGALLGIGVIGHQVTKAKKDLKEAASKEIEKLQDLVRAIQVKTGELEGRSRDAEGAMGDVAAETHNPLKDRAYKAWDVLRAKLEKTAARESIDGRVRARYARIDRRSYYDLARALHVDGQLEAPLSEWERAIGLWYAARRADSPEPSLVAELERLASELR